MTKQITTFQKEGMKKVRLAPTFQIRMRESLSCAATTLGALFEDFPAFLHDSVLRIIPSCPNSAAGSAVHLEGQALCAARGALHREGEAVCSGGRPHRPCPFHSACAPLLRDRRLHHRPGAYQAGEARWRRKLHLTGSICQMANHRQKSVDNAGFATFGSYFM